MAQYTALTTSAVNSGASSATRTLHHATMFERAMPKLTSGSQTASSSKKFATPTITPPSIKGNPHIWSSNKPSGTVFIAVGSIVGFIFLVIVLAYVISAYISRRQTDKLRYESVDHEFHSHVNGPASKVNLFSKRIPREDSYDSEKAGFLSKAAQTPQSRSVARLLDMQEPERMSPGLTHHDSTTSLAQEFYSSIQDQNTAQNRKSLFISPTVEVINQQRKSMLLQNLGNSTTSLISEPGTDLNRPERAASPSRKAPHQSRNKTSLSSALTSVKSRSTSPGKGSLREKPLDRAKIPSAYLEKMLEDGA